MSRAIDGERDDGHFKGIADLRHGLARGGAGSRHACCGDLWP